MNRSRGRRGDCTAQTDVDEVRLALAALEHTARRSSSYRVDDSEFQANREPPQQCFGTSPVTDVARTQPRGEDVHQDVGQTAPVRGVAVMVDAV